MCMEIMQITQQKFIGGQLEKFFEVYTKITKKLK